MAFFGSSGGECTITLTETQHVNWVTLLGVTVEGRSWELSCDCLLEVPNVVLHGVRSQPRILPQPQQSDAKLMYLEASFGSVDVILARNEETACGGLAVTTWTHVLWDLFPIGAETSNELIH